MPFLRHIALHALRVVDHLGQNISVPMIFCSTWKVSGPCFVVFRSGHALRRRQDFDYIIRGYCNNRAGNRFVQQGDYRVIRAEDNGTIDPSEFARTIKPGVVLEMSIVLRKKTSFPDKKQVCPRCDTVSLNVATHHGWIDWKVP